MRKRKPIQTDDEYAAEAVRVDEYARRAGARSRLPQFTNKPPTRDFHVVVSGFQLALNGLGIPKTTPHIDEFVESIAIACWKIFQLARDR